MVRNVEKKNFCIRKPLKSAKTGLWLLREMLWWNDGECAQSQIINCPRVIVLSYLQTERNFNSVNMSKYISLCNAESNHNRLVLLAEL